MLLLLLLFACNRTSQSNSYHYSQWELQFEQSWIRLNEKRLNLFNFELLRFSFRCLQFIQEIRIRIHGPLSKKKKKLQEKKNPFLALRCCYDSFDDAFKCLLELIFIKHLFFAYLFKKILKYINATSYPKKIFFF